MKSEIESMDKLINRFTKLPGVGLKTAQRYAYGILNMPEDAVKDFCDTLLSVKRKIKYCGVCGNFTEEDPCALCRTRGREVVCVVAEPKDVVALEKIKGLKCSYHVLGGTISPMEGRGPDDLRIKQLLGRIGGGVKEVIIATNTDVEGEATALYLARILKPLGVKTTRIAQGISMGTDIEYADEITLSRAIEDRREI